MHGTFGKLELIKPLGQGAMGEVYLARDPAIGREIAIKMIRKELLLAPNSRERFAREARAAGTLNHPNVVTIHEFGEIEETLYLAMEHVEGQDLSALLHSRELTPVEILDVMAQVCDGLAYAHGKGILHRDIKPSNIRVSRTSGRLMAKIMDFGIAHLSGSDMTGTGMLLGTFGYMAPEYIQTGIPTPCTDIFAVGVMLHEAFAGGRLFHGETTATILFKVVHDNPRPLDSSCFQGVSPKVQAVIRKALAKNPSQRFQEAGELAAALREAMNPAWDGLDTANFDQTTRRAVKPQSVLPQTSGNPASPITVIRTVAVSGPASLPWGWIAAAGVTLLSIGIWVGGRKGLERPKDAPANGNIAEKASPQSRETLSLRESDGTTQVRPPAPTEQGAPPRDARPEPPPMQGSANDREESADLDAYTKGEPSLLLERAEKVLNIRPGQPRAHALKLVALYRLGRYREMPAAYAEAARYDVRRPQLHREPLYAAMESDELKARRLPDADREGLFPPSVRPEDRGGRPFRKP